MATEQSLERWTKTLDEVLAPMQMSMPLLRKMERFAAPRQAEGAIRGLTQPILDAWQSDPPPPGTEIYRIIKPIHQAAQSLNPADDRIQQVSVYYDAVTAAKEKINDLDKEGTSMTVDEILIDMELELKLSVLVARIGHQGIMSLVDERRALAGRSVTTGHELPIHFDLQAMKPVPDKSTTTISFAAVLAKANPGSLTPDEFVRGDLNADKAPVLKRFAGQWIVSFYTEWEDLFRKQLASAHGCTVDDIRSQFFQELGRMRNDFGHGRGICQKSASNKILKWFARGDQMIPNHENYQQLFDEFAKALDELRDAPVAAAKKTDRQPVRGKVPPTLNTEFDRTVAGLSGISVDEALEDALRSWIDRNTAD
ncbi:hypothetical protein ACLBYD_27705 [Rhodococcus sp. C26F]